MPRRESTTDEYFAGFLAEAKRPASDPELQYGVGWTGARCASSWQACHSGPTLAATEHRSFRVAFWNVA
jgi:hypothetical protein